MHSVEQECVCEGGVDEAREQVDSFTWVVVVKGYGLVT